MSKLHGEVESKLGRGQLRKPGDYSDQPGQRVLTPGEYNERDSARFPTQVREAILASDKRARRVDRD